MNIFALAMRRADLRGSLFRFSLLLLLLAAAVVVVDASRITANALAQEGEPVVSCAAPTAVVLSETATVRFGPGANFAVVNTIPSDTEYSVLGRHPELAWWRISLPGGDEGWVADEQIQVRGDLTQIALIESDGEIVTVEASWQPAAMLPCLPLAAPPPASEPAADSMEPENDWSQPVNLSLSGQAVEPQAVVGSDGTAHILWKETGLQQFLYVTGDGENWSQARQIELPFGTRRYFPDLDEDSPTPLFTPQLLATNDGQVHAFWIDEERVLWHSALTGEFANFDDWSERQQLAESALGLDVASDGAGGLFASFIRTAETEEQPAGVYVVQMQAQPDGEVNVNDAVLVNNSRYLAISDEETAHTRLLTMAPVAEGSGNVVIVAWDNRPLDRVFVARSTNGGSSWEEPVIVDRREEDDDPDAVGPSRITLASAGQNVMLLWQAMHSGEACGQEYRWSADGGTTWTEREKLATIAGCPTYTKLMPAPDGHILLLTGSSQGVTLRAWNGTTWSDAQQQNVLTEFTNQETFRPVQLQCLQADWIAAQRLLVSGCSGSEPVDVWITSRELPSLEGWFASGPVWSNPRTLATGAAPPSDINSVQLVADDAGRFHAFWSVSGGQAINYAQSQGGQWTGAVSLLSSPSGATASHIATSYGPDNVLHAVWDSSDGQIYYSRVDVASAGQPSDWAAPRPLPTTQPGAQFPAIVQTASGRIYVAYTIPINEGRGIYLTYSEDGGETWGDPGVVFDGAAAGWQMVGSSQVASTGEERLHLLWSPAASSNVEGTTIYHAYSDDGRSFTTASLVEDVVAESVGLVAEGEQSLHRFWVTSGEVSTHWHAYSDDGGLTWSADAEFSNLLPRLAFTLDSSNQLHLLETDANWLTHLQWDGVRWLTVEQIEWDNGAAQGAFAIAPNGALTALYAVPSGSEDGGHEIVVLGREMGAEDVNAVTSSPTPQPSVVPTASAEAVPVSPVSTSTPEPTPTLSFDTSGAAGDVPTMISNVGIDAAGLGGAVGIAVVGIIFLIIFIRSLLSLRRHS